MSRNENLTIHDLKNLYVWFSSTIIDFVILKIYSSKKHMQMH
jgi:hypothetical protein